MATIKKSIKKIAKKAPTKAGSNNANTTSVEKKAIPKKAAPAKPAPKKRDSPVTFAPATAAMEAAREPALENTALNTLYLVDKSGNNITLEVNPGAKGQTSLMKITLDNNIIADDIAGDFEETILGTDTELGGKILRIVATIADTSDQTNFTSLTIRLKGGLENVDFPLSKTVDSQGDSADYIAKIKFFNS